MLTEEIDEVTERLAVLTTSAGRELVALFGVGTETAGQLLVTAGDNPERLRTEPRSPFCAAPLQFRLPRDAPTDTDSAEAGTARQTAPST